MNTLGKTGAIFTSSTFFVNGPRRDVVQKPVAIDTISFQFYGTIPSSFYPEPSFFISSVAVLL